MTKFCEHCGAPLPEGIMFCTGCGNPVAQPTQPSQQQNPSMQGTYNPNANRPFTGSQNQGNQQAYYQQGPNPYFQRPPEKKRTGLKVFLIVALVAVVGFGVWEFLSYKNTPQYTQSNQEETDEPYLDEDEDEDEIPMASSTQFTGVRFHSTQINFGKEAWSRQISEAMDSTIRNTHFKLDKNGDFNVTSTGSYSGINEDLEECNELVNVTMTLTGHIDRHYYVKPKGSFTMQATVDYHRSCHNVYFGDDEVNINISLNVENGEVQGEIFDDALNPLFEGKVNGIRKGTVVHTKGTDYKDKDYQKDIDDTDVKGKFSAKFEGEK